jgi:tetratricopeptide (TPR) repeat protein
VLARVRGDLSQARELSTRSLEKARRRGDDLNTAIALDSLGEVEYEDGAFEVARNYLEEALTIHRRLRNQQWIGESLWQLGNVAREQNDFTLADRRYGEARTLWEDAGYRRGVGVLGVESSLVALERRDADTARLELARSLDVLEPLGEQRYIAYAIEALTVLACLRDEAEEAFALIGAATALRDSIGAPRPPVDERRLERWLEKVAARVPIADQNAARSLGAVTPIEDLVRAYRTAA